MVNNMADMQHSAPLWNVPYRRTPFFTGREDLLAQLEEEIATWNSVALKQPYTCASLGGIGKTQLAVEYAYRSRPLYQAIFWVRASSREKLVADFVKLARLLALPDHDSTDQQSVVVAVQRWFTQNRSWLLILDEADDLTLLTDFLPTGGDGHLLITTRASATSKIAPFVTVDKMNQDEGSLFLLRRAGLLAPGRSLSTVKPAVRTSARLIVQVLEGLPLALALAGGFLAMTKRSLAEYLELFRQQRTALVAQQNNAIPAYSAAVACACMISLRQIESIRPQAVDLLRLAAFLDADAIPQASLIQQNQVACPIQAAADSSQRQQALQSLLDYGLLLPGAAEGVLIFHRLLQAVLKADMDGALQQRWAVRAAQLMPPAP
ncbi:hypothetical protein EPA93_24340 [Ktedonosporobacter rubrisoli]|uniref:DUF7779 domain-containing protein n=1 Tax=Ktedonosporobacter rubrisoli TaxID=2509675 RepID=A0A4V0YZ95_KTERU|nr:NB-ARC domain-containing protein [Ktedonosporobacter rubrisoli]QBD78941.1 hypothetical protein EPA93_24340 [Ktedonosporobacter rubrisoli]